MRPCVQHMLRPLLLASAPTRALGVRPLDGVPAVDGTRGEGLVAALVALLAWHGREVSYDWLLGVSGLAWRVAWRRDLGWCPSALQVAGDDPLAAMGWAVGAQWRRRGGLPWLRAVEAVRQRLAVRRPVATCGLWGQAEWSVLIDVGRLRWQPGDHYDDPPRPELPVTARTPFDTDGPSRLVLGRWYGWSAGTPGWTTMPLVWLHALTPTRPTPRQVARRVLAAAVQAAAPVQQGAFECGAAAWQAWGRALCDDAEFAALPEVELRRRAWTQRELCQRLAAARHDGSAFLDALTPTCADAAARRLLALAARDYRRTAAALAAAAGPGDAPASAATEGLGGASWRHEAAGCLAEAEQHDRLAAGWLARAAARLD